MPQRAQRTDPHFLVHFCELSQNHRSPVAQNFHQFLQGWLNTPCGFEYDQREAGRCGTCNQSLPLTSLSRQEPERQEWAIY